LLLLLLFLLVLLVLLLLLLPNRDGNAGGAVVSGDGVFCCAFVFVVAAAADAAAAIAWACEALDLGNCLADALLSALSNSALLMLRLRLSPFERKRSLFRCLFVCLVVHNVIT